MVVMASDLNFLQRQGFFGGTTFSSNHSGQKLVPGTNASSLRTSIPRYPPRVVPLCKASSNRRGSNFPVKYIRGSSQNKRQSLVKKTLEDNPLPSKNQSQGLVSHNQRYSATATPGRREKEIVELFKKVQSQLRERAAIKEEKRVKATHAHVERETVNSLVSLLRKHLVAQWKEESSSDDLAQPDGINPFQKPGRNSDLLEEGSNSRNSLLESQEMTDVAAPEPKPILNSQSHPLLKLECLNGETEMNLDQQSYVYSSGSGDDIDADTQMADVAALEPKPILNSESHPMLKLECLNGETEMNLDQQSYVYSSNSGDDIDADTEMLSEPSAMPEGAPDLSSMKLLELREFAKSKGIKGYSKLKKSDLLELLAVTTHS